MSRIEEFDERELRWQLANLGVSAKAEAGVAQLRALLLDVGWTYQVNKDAAHKRFGEAFYFKLGDQTSQYKRPAVGENGLGLACFDVRSQLLHFGVPAATVASKSANWSPMHLRAPPPKGMNAKSDATSLGYSAEPRASGL